MLYSLTNLLLPNLLSFLAQLLFVDEVLDVLADLSDDSRDHHHSGPLLDVLSQKLLSFL